MREKKISKVSKSLLALVFTLPIILSPEIAQSKKIRDKTDQELIALFSKYIISDSQEIYKFDKSKSRDRRFFIILLGNKLRNREIRTTASNLDSAMVYDFSKKKPITLRLGQLEYQQYAKIKINPIHNNKFDREFIEDKNIGAFVASKDIGPIKKEILEQYISNKKPKYGVFEYAKNDKCKYVQVTNKKNFIIKSILFLSTNETPEIISCYIRFVLFHAGLRRVLSVSNQEIWQRVSRTTPKGRRRLSTYSFIKGGPALIAFHYYKSGILPSLSGEHALREFKKYLARGRK